MKYLFAIFSVVLLFSACSSDSNSDGATDQESQESLLQAQQDSLLEVLRQELQAIDEKMDRVGENNGIFEEATDGNQVLSRERIIEKVEALDRLLKNNQAELDNMYNRMRATKLENKKFERMIQSMQERVAQREGEIQDLMSLLSRKDLEIADIKLRVDSMRMENIDLTEDLMEMEDQMHTVYFVVGEGKDLRSQGIVTKEGGLLGVGGSKQLDVSALDESKFQQTDMRDLNEVLLYSRKARLITNHPESAYELVNAADGTVEKLTILDKEAFWKASDYLVVEVSN